MYRESALILFVAVFSAVVTWYVLTGRFEATIAKLKLEHQKAATLATERHIAALRRADEDYKKLKKEKDDAIERASIRAAANADALAAARVELDGLRRDLSDARARIATAPVAALREYAATVGELYGECEAELAETAAKATGHASDVQLILEAFPKEAD